MYKIKYIPTGMIIWENNVVLGITGVTLPDMFGDCYCYKLPGNDFDFAMCPENKYTKKQQDFINKTIVEWNKEDQF